MPYYLITKTQYNTDHIGLTCLPAWNLDGTKCVINAPDNYTVSNPEQTWGDANECNEWRYSDTEWSNWMTEEEKNGE